MGIPIDDDMARFLVLQLQMKERKEEAARRKQEDYKVFVSYSHEDLEIVRQLRAIFDRAKIHYEVDEKFIGFGDPISEGIEAQIEKCTHYLLILSANSMKAPWCTVEYGLARGKGKKVLIYLASRDLDVPPYYATVLATADPREVADYFTRKLIDPAAVERFLGEILDESPAKLEEFRRVGETISGRIAWDHPDRGAIEEVSFNPYIHNMNSFPDNLIRIELGDAGLGEPLVVTYHQPSAVDRTYTLLYNEDLRAVVIEGVPSRDNSWKVGIREVTDEGEVQFRRSRSSNDEWAHRRQLVQGWSASRGFWEEALCTLRTKLPS